MTPEKELLEGYVGVKYTPVCLDKEFPASCGCMYAMFRACGDRLLAHDMAPANGGNLSQRVDQGLVITSAGSNLGFIEPWELSWVESCSVEQEEVSYSGPREPSSEAMMHWLIYRDFPEAGAVVHAHDPEATREDLLASLPNTPREEPYGTAALARLAVQTFRGGDDIIVLKNHGYVTYAKDLRTATERVVEMHNQLLAGEA